MKNLLTFSLAYHQRKRGGRSGWASMLGQIVAQFYQEKRMRSRLTVLFREASCMDLFNDRVPTPLTRSLYIYVLLALFLLEIIPAATSATETADNLKREHSEWCNV